MPPALRAAFPASVMAKTMHHSAVGALLVQSLRPEIFQPSAVLTARVLIMLASEPAPGSDRPKHIEVSPVIIPARHRWRACSVACVSSRLGPNAQCAITQWNDDTLPAEPAIDRLPGNVVGEMPEAAAADLDRRAHRVKSGLRGQHPDLADQLACLGRIPPVFVIEPALIFQQRMVSLDPWRNLCVDETQHAVAYVQHILRKIKRDAAHRKTPHSS